MNHQLEHKARSAELHRRITHLNRADVLDPFDNTATEAKSTSVSSAAATSAADTHTTSKTSSVAATSQTATSASSATSATSSSASSSSSTTSSSATSSSSSSSSSATSSSKATSTSSSTTSASTQTAVTSATNVPVASRTVATYVTYTPSSSGTGTAAISSSSTTTTSGGVSAGSIVGGIFGTIGGILVIAVIVAFVVRRIRNRRRDDEHFDAAQFRHSAVLIDDEFGNDNFSARPPTMIARHMANAPAAPPVTYGNYPGADPYSPGDPFTPTDQYHPGGPYGHYNAYPTYTQDPVYTLNPGDTFARNNPISPSASGGFAGEMDPSTAHNTYLNRQPTLRGQDTQHVDAHTQQYLDMNRVASPPSMPASADYNHGMPSPSSATPLYNPHSSVDYNAPLPSPPLQNPHAPIKYPEVGAAAPSAPAVAAPAAHQGDMQKRPDTVYDPEDAYGGM
ncbi:hypothetical protein EV361DRAFT_299925 [Lentinula raphanica]|uniref:Uncharacterized protein n=1 Tax=Lentinula raphanica TaxID=153919 RepID=A0AA38PBL7_9AGAR|nr:hypothetical protein F5880DRAFT_1614357 [Lentinula raphanica]KAJ3839913.1 hypothetical protein F5878DRAFT_659871 [Lentinula raphanica]KAJ3970181.1 hypothetical protein EV361DRAFT_299925 [Lentinula raphanica]